MSKTNKLREEWCKHNKNVTGEYWRCTLCNPIEKPIMKSKTCLKMGEHKCPNCVHKNQEGIGNGKYERSWCFHCKKILVDTFPKKMKTNKLREEVREAIGNLSDESFEYGENSRQSNPELEPDWREKIDKIIELHDKAIQAEKKKWKQEALKAMPEEIELKENKIYEDLVKNAKNAIEAVAYKESYKTSYKHKIYYNEAIRKCKKAITDL